MGFRSSDRERNLISVPGGRDCMIDEEDQGQDISSFLRQILHFLWSFFISFDYVLNSMLLILRLGSGNYGSCDLGFDGLEISDVLKPM